MATQRELKQKFITEGAEDAAAKAKAVADAQSGVGKATDQVAGAAQSASKATEDLNIKKENLTNILGKIHPALGGMADGLINAAELAGALGTANLSLTGVLGGTYSAIIKNKNALMLLGAGGAAFAAVAVLVAKFKELKQEVSDTIDLIDKFEGTQRSQEQKREEVRKNVLEAFARTNPNASDDEIRKATDKAVNLNENLDLDAGRSALIGVGLDRISDDEASFRRRQFGIGSRREEAREQLGSFTRVPGLFGTFGKVTDTGNQAALLQNVEQSFGDTGQEAQDRIRAAQTLQAAGDLGVNMSEQDIGKASGFTPAQTEAGRQLNELLAVSAKDLRAAAAETLAASKAARQANEEQAAMMQAAAQGAIMDDKPKRPAMDGEA